MSLSNSIRLMVAKSDRTNSNMWLPFIYHSLDTAGMMDYLYNTRYNYLTNSVDISGEVLNKTANLLALLHDIGKLTPVFQCKILQSVDRKSIMEHYEISIPEYSDEDKRSCPHTICGEAILLQFGFQTELAEIIGAHHGMPADGSVKKYIESHKSCFYGKSKSDDFWKNLWKEWIDYSLEKSGFSTVDEIPKLNKRAMILLCGLLITADWMASNQENFCLIDNDEIPSEHDYPRMRLEKALDRLDLPEVWESDQYYMTESDFEKRFSFKPKNIQKKLIDEINSCNDPGIFIIEAPMGIGKTEAALAAAEMLANRTEKTGIFFGLPTQATANGIFERVAGWANQQSEEFYHSIMLAHSNAFFQPLFANMPRKIPQVGEDSDSGLIVHSFFCGNKQSCLADFVVGTIDHLLMAALKKKHAMLIHLGLSQKVVIIDECHAYDAYMNKYLDVVLSWLGKYKVPVIMLSATLPKQRRNTLIEAYLNKPLVADNEEFRNEFPYPLLTFTDSDKIHQCRLPFSGKSKFVDIIFMNEELIFDKIKKAVNAGGCVGIICNTVLKAQKLYKTARGIHGCNVILYHAQFILPDRADKEKELIDTIGKKSKYSDRKGVIVIGTQVLEQSLDIDFDLLITDLCPMDLLLQRIGRMHRHERPDRPLKNAECIVIQTDENEKANQRIYGKWLLMRTKKLLPEKVCIPDDIAPLVNKTYSDDIEFETQVEKDAYEDYLKTIKKKEVSAKSFLMAKPPSSENSRSANRLHGWLNAGVSENKALAAVRDGISSVEVIVMIEYKDKSLGILNWKQENGKRFSSAVCPENEDCKLIAQQKVRLPSVFCQEWNVDKTIDEIEKSNKHLAAFQNSHWLKGELILLLDENLTASLIGYKLKYTQSEGLSYEKEEIK